MPQPRTTRIVLELSEPEPGVFAGKAVRDDGAIALVESDSLYEAGAYAIARLTADIGPVRA